MENCACYPEHELRLKQCEKHVEEGEAPQTGARDRLLILEFKVKSIQKDVIRAGVYGGVAGFIGGLLGRVVPDLITYVLKLFG